MQAECIHLQQAIPYYSCQQSLPVLLSGQARMFRLMQGSEVEYRHVLHPVVVDSKFYLWKFRLAWVLHSPGGQGDSFDGR